jgi:hypothetical protein
VNETDSVFFFANNEFMYDFNINITLLYISQPGVGKVTLFTAQVQSEEASVLQNT